MLLQTALQQPAAVPHCCHCRCTICHLMIYALPHSAHHPCCQSGLLLQPAGTKALVQLHCSMAPSPACWQLPPVKYSAQTASQKMLSAGNVFLSSAHKCTFRMIPLGLLWMQYAICSISIRILDWLLPYQSAITSCAAHVSPHPSHAAACSCVVSGCVPRQATKAQVSGRNCKQRGVAFTYLGKA